MDDTKLEALFDEIRQITDTDGIDSGEALELVRIKISSFLAHNPDDAVELAKMMESDFMRRRVVQLVPGLID